MRKPIAAILFVSGLGIFQSARAQTFEDVLRYSQRFYSTSARSAGAGNAFGALGADPLSSSINPAGMGMYNFGEFSGSLGLTHAKASSLYQGTEATDDRYNFHIGNINLVFTDQKSNLGKPVSEGWVSVNYGFSLNRTNNFNQNFSLETLMPKDKQVSAIDAFVQEANGQTTDMLTDQTRYSFASQAYNAYLINPVNNTTEYRGVHKDETRLNLYQRDEVSKRGSMNDLNFSISANRSNKLYLGATIMIPTVGYSYTRVFTEENRPQAGDSIRNYKGFTTSEYLTTSGLGFSGIVGVIYKPVKLVRLGVSAQLPTFYSLTDDYGRSTQSYMLHMATAKVESAQLTNSYSLVTPWRYTLSGAVLLKDKGFVSLDYEVVNYQSGRVNYEGSRTENKNVTYYLQPAGNLRLGAELKLIDGFAVRAGYGFYGSPIKKEFVLGNNDLSANSYSFGLGYREKGFFADLAYQSYTSRMTYTPLYFKQVPAGFTPESSVKQTSGTVLLTVGTKF